MDPDSSPRLFPRLAHSDALGTGVVLIAVGALTLGPLALLVYGSFHSAPPGVPSAPSTAGWAALLDAGTLRVFADTVLASFLKTAIALGLAVGFAWLVARTDLPGGRALEFLLALPFFLPQILTALAWAMLGTPKGGAINLAWNALTGSTGPLINIYSFGGVIWHMTQYAVPFLFMLVVTALRNMDPALEESSRMAGATSWRTFRRITLGVMLPVIAGGFLLSFVRGLDGFESAMFFGTPAGIDLLTTRLYRLINYQQTPDYPQAAALSLVVTLLMFALLAVQWRLVGRHSHRTVGGKGWRPSVITLGRWRWTAFAACAAYVIVTVVLPVVQLGLGSFTRFFGFYRADMLTLAHWREVLASARFWEAARNSVLLGAAAAVLTLVLGAVTAGIIARQRTGLARALDALAWTPWMLPGMVFAIGFLWLVSVLPEWLPLYGTPGALLVAYITLGLPLTVRALASAFGQIDRELEECSRVHGAGRWRTFRLILLPLTWPAFAVGGIMVFFMVLRELSASALLYSPGNEVLPVVVMRLWSEGRAGPVSVIALLMLGLVLVFRLVEAVVPRTGPGRGRP